MNDNPSPHSMWERFAHFVHDLDKSALLTIIGIIALFSTAVAVTLIAPRHVDPTWTAPSSDYQVQMYEIEDPNMYISAASSQNSDLQYVHHIKSSFTLLSFNESETLRFVSKPELDSFVTHIGDPELKLTSRLLLVRQPQGEMKEKAEKLRLALQEKNQSSEESSDKQPFKFNYRIIELYDPEMKEAFAVSSTGDLLQNWVDENYIILDEPQQDYHRHQGVVFIKNPSEFRVSEVRYDDEKRFIYNPQGESIKDLNELKNPQLGFHSRKELISMGEQIYAWEGCWYCHTDQTRTLVQDVVQNGSENFPAPPSSANEYIYQKITFPGTRRIGPDLSRTGVKRPSRDWHKGHFWAPKTQSPGSIMPAFRHFFDNDPRGTAGNAIGIPNYRFEALYQYLLTKGTRITPPTQAWWLGKDPVNTKGIIEGEVVLK